MKTISRAADVGAVFFLINPQQDQSTIYQRSEQSQLYNTKKTGFVRKAIVQRVQTPQSPERFTDHQFTLQSPSTNFRLVRLYDLYKREELLFPRDETESSYILPQQSYNSFQAESGVIGFNYLKTLFVTQRVNARGYYQYFVKRNGQYFLQQCDDFILVDKFTLRPIWGLELSHPWQIILFKAWAKQVGSVQRMYEMEPFSFLQAFGLPQYQVFNFRKQLNFIMNERVAQNTKAQKINQFTMKKTNITIIARTVNSAAVRNVGLVPNVAAYKILRLQDTPNLYQVYSSLPCNWVGSHSAVYNSPLNGIYNSNMSLDLQRNILMTERQIMTYFNKFYVVPNMVVDPTRLFVQDCYNLRTTGEPIWLKFNVLQDGMVGMSIQIQKRRGGTRNVYPQFRYFLSKRVDQRQASRSHFRQDIAGSRLQQNMYISSSCDKWQYYRIDYVQGYENHSSFFAKAQRGEYVLFIDPQMAGLVRVRIDSHVPIQQPIQFIPTPQQAKQIFDSTFFSISRETSVEATFNNRTWEQSIALNNSFQELGYGSICIKTLQKAKHKIAMRVYPDKLRAAGLQLLSHYSGFQEDERRQKNLVLISSKGRPEIIVLERINNRSRTQIGQVFPPVGTVQFFKVMPNAVLMQMGQQVLQQQQFAPRPVSPVPVPGVVGIMPSSSIRANQPTTSTVVTANQAFIPANQSVIGNQPVTFQPGLTNSNFQPGLTNSTIQPGLVNTTNPTLMGYQPAVSQIGTVTNPGGVTAPILSTSQGLTNSQVKYNPF